jgi:ADP-heptose:LPS heptosyltransferase
VNECHLDVLVDCRWYRGSMPCAPHKQAGRRCSGCASYDPVGARILIIKVGALGDVLRTTALLPSIRQCFPGAHVTWLTANAARSLLQGNSLIDRVLTVDDRYLEVLLTERFDVCLCLDNDALAAAAGRLARCGVLRGFAVSDAGAVVPASRSARTWWQLGIDDRLKRQNRRTWFDLMSELCEVPFVRARPQLTIPPAAASAAQQQLSRWRSRSRHPLVGLNTGGGARWAQKQWTFAGYTGFVRQMRAMLPHAQVVVLGGPEERSLNRDILADVREFAVDGGCHDDVHRFAALVEGMDVLVTSDSLGFHVATAVGIRVVAIVGPSSPWELDTFGTGEILTGDSECLACYRAQCDKPVTCMERLEVATVVGATLRQIHALEPLQQNAEELVPVASLPAHAPTRVIPGTPAGRAD